jgi:hypothetical protein
MSKKSAPLVIPTLLIGTKIFVIRRRRYFPFAVVSRQTNKYIYMTSEPVVRYICHLDFNIGNQHFTTFEP